MLAFAEEGVVDHLNDLLPTLNSLLAEGEENKPLNLKVKNILKLIGRYSPATSFEPIVLSIINMKLTENEETAIQGLTTYKYLLEGYFEALPPKEGLLRKATAVRTALSTLGSEEYLDQLTKYMIQPFAELFEAVMKVVATKASPKERSSLLEEFKSQTTKVSLCALTIPIFMLVTDNSIEVNFKLIKSSIEGTSKLPTDSDAKYYLALIDKISADDRSTLLGISKDGSL